MGLVTTGIVGMMETNDIGEVDEPGYKLWLSRRLDRTDASYRRTRVFSLRIIRVKDRSEVRFLSTCVSSRALCITLRGGNLG